MIDRTGAKLRAKDHLHVSLNSGVGVELLRVLLYFCWPVINVGASIFYLNVSRNNRPKALVSLDGLDIALKSIWLAIVRWFFIFVWSLTGLLLVLIGSLVIWRVFALGVIIYGLGLAWTIIIVIYKALSYSMTDFALANNPTLNATDCMNLSKAITKEVLGELFIVHLTFLGWRLLNGFTLGLLGVFYLNPYMSVTLADIFDQLHGGNISAEKPTIKCIAGVYKGYDFGVDDVAEVIIGRDGSQAHVIILEGAEKISRKHCGIIFDSLKDEYKVIDYSQNGTYLADGTRMPAGLPTSVRRGSVIYIGDRKNGFLLS